jgi:hypothetical protein
VAVGYLSAAIIRERTPPLKSVVATALRVGFGLALIRLAILYSAFSLLSHMNSGRPLVFVLLVVNSAVEYGVTAASCCAGAWPSPSPFVAVMIGLTSLLLGCAWAWVRSQSRSGAAA